MSDDERMIVQELIFQLSRMIRGVDNEGTNAVVEGVSIVGFATLDDDVREEVLALATHWGWTDGPEFFASLNRRAA